MDPLKKLKRPPVIFVLAQVVFSPILEMEDYIPDIQKKMRELGFPKFREENNQKINIMQNEVSSNSEKRWVFHDKNNFTFVCLGQRFLTFQTTEYSVFSNFHEKLKKILIVLENKFRSLIIERIGLRYIDLIKTMDGITYDNFLTKEMRGLSFDEMSPDNLIQHSIVQMKIAEAILRINIIKNNEGLMLPPDLNIPGLKFPDNIEKPKQGEFSAILDTDYFVENLSEDFTADFIINKLIDFHDEGIRRVFKLTCTDEAFEIWGKDNEQ